MNFLELEDLCKAPVPSQWVVANRASIFEAVNDYLSWGTDPEEEQQTLNDLAWKLAKTWSYEMMNEVMPYLSAENQTTHLVHLVESVGSENAIEYDQRCNLSVCAPFFKQWVKHLRVGHQIEVLQSFLEQEYNGADCLSTALRMCAITLQSIDGEVYEQERNANHDVYWKLSSNLLSAVEYRSNYAPFLEKIAQFLPSAIFSALHFVVALQNQSGYCPSPNRIELFNERLLPFLTEDEFENLSKIYTTVNAQRQKNGYAPMVIPPPVMNFILKQAVQQLPSEPPTRPAKI